MPIYTFKCLVCLLRMEKTFLSRELSDEDPVVPCDACGGSTEKVLNPGKIGGRKPYHGQKQFSEKYGVMPHEIADAKKTMPWMEYDETGRAVFRDSAHHKECIEKINKALDAEAAEAATLEGEIQQQVDQQGSAANVSPEKLRRLMELKG